MAVGSFAPNAWGLVDMHGNVSEWCQNWYEWDYPSGHTDPKGSTSGSLRVLRGGNWVSNPWFLRSADRSDIALGDKYSFHGFRVARREATLQYDSFPRSCVGMHREWKWKWLTIFL